MRLCIHHIRPDGGRERWLLPVPTPPPATVAELRAACPEITGTIADWHIADDRAWCRRPFDPERTPEARP